jgi:NADH dehydrogenase
VQVEIEGPVVVTGASGHVGRRLVRRLEELSVDVRPLGRDEVGPAAFEDVAAVVHLAGTLQPLRGNSYEAANVGTARRTADALAGSSVARVVLLSYTGADAGAANAYLQTKGQAEQVLRAACPITVVLRSTFIFGPPDDPGPSTAPFIAGRRASVSVIGNGRQRYAPVFVNDVVETLARAALQPDVSPRTLALAGPDVLTVDDVVRAVNRRPVRIRHLSRGPARVLARVVPALTPALVDVLAADSLPDGPSATEAFGIGVRRLVDVYGVERPRDAAARPG